MDPSNSLTFCVRLNYKRLGEKSYVFFVESAQEGGEPFLWVKANYPNSWFGFGNFETSMAYSNWILNDPINEEFRLDQYLISEVTLKSRYNEPRYSEFRKIVNENPAPILWIYLAYYI